MPSGFPAGEIDFGELRKFAANTVHYASAENLVSEFLSGAALLEEFDFLTRDNMDCSASVTLECDRAGTCHGLLGWFDMKLGSSWVSTGPGAEPMHWSLAFLPLDPPLELKKHDVLSLQLSRPEYAEWTWEVTHNGSKQRHSTFLSRLPDIGHLKSQATDHVPELNEKGLLAQYVLQAMAAGKNVGELLATARKQFGQRYRHERQFDIMVRKLIAQWGADKD